jgi:charged multivesicular body protein 4A/B
LLLSSDDIQIRFFECEESKINLYASPLADREIWNHLAHESDVFLFILVALQALKRKKRYEQQLEQLQGTLTTIETQREALENANTNAAVLDTMKGAADALKKTHKDMNVDNVHEMMDDIAEQNDVANEISNAISTGIIGSGVDEDELAKELEELEQEELDKDLLNVGPAPAKLPEVPSTDLPSSSKDKEKKKGLCDDERQ